MQQDDDSISSEEDDNDSVERDLQAAFDVDPEIGIVVGSERQAKETVTDGSQQKIITLLR